MGTYPSELGNVLGPEEYARMMRESTLREQQQRQQEYIANVAREAVKNGQAKEQAANEEAPKHDNVRAEMPPLEVPRVAPDSALRASARLGAIAAPNPAARAFGAGLIAGIVVGGLATMAMMRGTE